VINHEGVKVAQEKITAIKKWPIPLNLTQLRGFLGLCSYYRRFIKGFSTISTPLTEMTKKVAYVCTNEAQLAYERLKEVMTTSPVLIIPDFSLPFTINYDASGIGIGAILMKKGCPISFESRNLKPHEREYSTYDKEMLSIMHALLKFKQYLICGKD